MTKALHYLGYLIMTLGAFCYLALGREPPLPGLAVLSTFVGGSIALHGASKINLRHSDRLGVTLDLIRVGGLIVLCLTLLAFGRTEVVRTPLMLLAIALAIVFLIQTLMKRGTEVAD